MGLILWVIAAIIGIAGILQLFQGQILWGIVLLVVAGRGGAWGVELLSLQVTACGSPGWLEPRGSQSAVGPSSPPWGVGALGHLAEQADYSRTRPRFRSAPPARAHRST